MRWFKSPSRITSDSNLGLTEEGRKRADESSGNNPRYEVLATLREHGSCTLGELSEETNIDVNKLKHIVKSLKAQGYIKHTGMPQEE